MTEQERPENFSDSIEQKEKPVASIVTLTPDDWERYKEIRLRALQLAPTAFGRSYEEDLVQPEEVWRSRLEDRTKMFGAEVGGKLVGLTGIRYESMKKAEHMATIVSVYVDPEFRGQKIGERLMTQALDDLKADPKITKIRLTVNSPQEVAQEMYKKLGFEQSGYSKNELKVDGKYIDQIQMEMILEDKIK